MTPVDPNMDLDQTEKYCGGCDRIRNISEFSFRGEEGKKHLRRSRCVHCVRGWKRKHQRKRDATPEGRFDIYQRSAKKRNIQFELTLDEFKRISSNLCYYCCAFKEGADYSGIDRVNSDIGYCLTNIVPCCTICNYLKGILGHNEFLNHLLKITTHQIKNNPFNFLGPPKY